MLCIAKIVYAMKKPSRSSSASRKNSSDDVVKQHISRPSTAKVAQDVRGSEGGGSSSEQPVPSSHRSTRQKASAKPVKAKSGVQRTRGSRSVTPRTALVASNVQRCKGSTRPGSRSAGGGRIASSERGNAVVVVPLATSGQGMKRTVSRGVTSAAKKVRTIDVASDGIVGYEEGVPGTDQGGSEAAVNRQLLPELVQKGAGEDGGPVESESNERDEQEVADSDIVPDRTAGTEDIQDEDGDGNRLGDESGRRNVDQGTTRFASDAFTGSFSVHNLEKRIRDGNMGMRAELGRFFDEMKQIQLDRTEEQRRQEQEVLGRIDRMEARMTRIENIINIQMFAVAGKGKSVREQERLMMLEILKPVDSIFAGKFMTSIFLRSMCVWAMGIREDMAIEAGLRAGTETVSDSEKDLAVMVRGGLLILEALFFSRMPLDLKTTEFVTSNEAKSHFTLRRMLTKSLLWYAAQRPDVACANIPVTIPNRVRGGIERTNAPFWLRKGFVSKEVQNEVLDEMEQPSANEDGRGSKVRKGATPKGGARKPPSTGVLDDGDISREVVRRLLKTETQWFNKARDGARKALFQGMTYVFHSKVNAMLMKTSTEDGNSSFSSLPSAKVTAEASCDSEEVIANNATWAQLCEDNPGMFYLAKYNVHVGTGSSKEEKLIQILFSPLVAARQFLTAYSRSDTGDALCASSTDMYKVTYMVALVFQMFIVEASEGETGMKFLDSEDIRRVRALYDVLRYNNEQEIEKVLRDKMEMSKKKYTKLNTVVGGEEPDGVAEEDPEDDGDGEEDMDADIVDMDGIM